jgi:stachyose synthetase
MLIESKSKAGENEIPSADNSSVIEMGLKAFIVDLRKEFKGLDEVYFWHALCGGLGGIRPGTAHLHVKHIPIKTYPVVKCMMQGLAVDKVVEARIGLVNLHQAVDFYNSMHSYMAGAGATGVKVNVIHVSPSNNYQIHFK